jgi:glycosyltransferase involved in cell wall biosynthesis
MRARQIDHVHAHFGTNSAAVALLVHALGGPAFSFTVHGPEEFEKPEALKLREKIAAASFVVVVSEFGRSLLQKTCDEQSWKKIQVIRCGLDSEFLSSTRRENRNGAAHIGKRLICVGRLSPQKAHSVLLEAAGMLAKQGTDFELILVGDGPLRNEIEQQIRDLNLENYVRLRGWLGGGAVREEILAARALVLSSWAEGLPVVLMEAMALGKAVVATRVAGVPELVTDPVHGRLVTAGDAAGLAEAMREVLLLSDEQLKNIADAAVAQVSLLHNVTTEAAKLAVLFSDVDRSKTGGA